MPRKAATAGESVELALEPRRSSRIKEQPKPEVQKRAPAKPRAKKADKEKQEGEADKGEKPKSSRGKKRKELETAEANGAALEAEGDEPPAKKSKPSSKAAAKPSSKVSSKPASKVAEAGKPSSKTGVKPASKASAKPASKADAKSASKPPSRAGSKKPVSKTHLQLNQVEGQESSAAAANIAETITEEPEAEAQAGTGALQPDEATA